jgi:flagellar basal-body rod protein FlgG
MLASMFIAVSGIRTQINKFNISAHNIANINTTGYKARTANLSEQAYGGAALDSVQIDNDLGIIINSPGGFSMSINGPGYFVLQDAEGNTFYTRDGSFGLDDQGRLVSDEGVYVQPGFTILLEAKGVNVGRDGTISVVMPDGETRDLGRIQLADFSNPSGLSVVGDNLFEKTVASGEPVYGSPGENTLGEVVFGTVEGSNVNIATEMVNMIISQRALEANVEILRAADEVFGSLLDIRS